jgi:hypothetical protein
MSTILIFSWCCFYPVVGVGVIPVTAGDARSPFDRVGK